MHLLQKRGVLGGLDMLVLLLLVVVVVAVRCSLSGMCVQQHLGQTLGPTMEQLKEGMGKPQQQ
jgi:hypothetical protein